MYVRIVFYENIYVPSFNSSYDNEDGNTQIDSSKDGIIEQEMQFLYTPPIFQNLLQKRIFLEV